MQLDVFAWRKRLSTIRLPRLSLCPHGALLLASVLLATGATHAADDYLSELNAEADKIDARQIDGEAGPGGAVPGLAAIGGAPREGATRDGFEGLLKDKYLGTYGFYKKLPERSRQEIFQEYAGGAPMTDVRKKIIDRLLQR